MWACLALCLPHSEGVLSAPQICSVPLIHIHLLASPSPLAFPSQPPCLINCWGLIARFHTLAARAQPPLLKPRGLVCGREVGGRFKREETYIYHRLICVDVWQKPTQFCRVIIIQLKINKSLKEMSSFLSWPHLWFVLKSTTGPLG